MENFVIYNPSLVFFGKNVIKKLPSQIDNSIKKVLLLYGSGSILKNGVYNDVVSRLKEANIEYVEYSGIKSNPDVEDADAALELVRKNNLQAIVAVGGGSVIDTAKIIAAAALYPNKAWDLIDGSLVSQKAIPIFAVLTLAATGSEMNNFAVIQSKEKGLKESYVSPLIFPKVSFLDPSYTLSVPKNYTAYGLVDLCAHSLEAYFGVGESELADKIVCSIIKEAIEIGVDLLKKPNDYELRARMMYAATMALNGTTVHGKKSGDWAVHGIGHILSFEYGVPHGASLSIVYPAWLKLQSNRISEKISKLGAMIFGVSDVNQVIQRFEALFSLWGAPIRISQLNIENFDENRLFELMKKSSVNGYSHLITEEDYLILIDLMDE